MLNNYTIYKESVMVTNNLQAIKREAKNLGDNFEIIKSNAGREVLLLRTTSPIMGLIYTDSGRQYEVPLSILVDEFGDNLGKKLEALPVFVYQMICTSDTIKEPHTKFRTPLMQVGYK